MWNDSYIVLTIEQIAKGERPTYPALATYQLLLGIPAIVNMRDHGFVLSISCVCWTTWLSMQVCCAVYPQVVLLGRWLSTAFILFNDLTLLLRVRTTFVVASSSGREVRTALRPLGGLMFASRRRSVFPWYTAFISGLLSWYRLPDMV